MTSQLALFGTSADPPTVGHRAVLAGLMQLFPRVCTWASDNPFKQHGAPLDVRAALLGAVVNSLTEQAGSDRLQLRQDFSSRRAIDSIEAARRCFPDDDLVFVVGTDLVAQIPSWYAVEAWLPGCSIAVVQRQGWPMQAGDLQRLQALCPQVAQLPLEIPAAASSSVRHHPNPELVPSELLTDLAQQNLYGFSIDDLPCADRTDPIQPAGR